MWQVKVVHKDWRKWGIGSDDVLGSISESQNITLDNLDGVKMSHRREWKQVSSWTQIIAAAEMIYGSTRFITANGEFGDDGTCHLYALSPTREGAGVTYKKSWSYNTWAIIGDTMLAIATGSTVAIDYNLINQRWYEEKVADMTAWTKWSTWTGTTSLSITAEATRSNCTKNLTLVSGNTYKIRVTLLPWSTGNLVVKWGSTAVWTITEPTDVYNTNSQSYSFFFLAPASETRSLTLEPAAWFSGTVTYTETRIMDLTHTKTLNVGGSVALYDAPYVYIASENILKWIKIWWAISSLVVEDFLTLPSWEDIVWMTASGQYLNVYAVWANYTVKYIWDKVSEFPIEKIKREWKVASSVAGNGNEDYILMGWLYVSSWYQLQPLIDPKKWFSQSSWEYKIDTLGWFIGDKLTIIWQKWWLSTPCVFTYWSPKAWLDKIFVREQVFDRWFSWYKPNSIKGVWPWLYATNYSGFIIEASTYSYNRLGYFVDTPVNFLLPSDIKTQNKIRIGWYINIGKGNVNAELDSATWVYWWIKVYCSINDSKYTTVTMYDNKTTPPSVWDTYSGTDRIGTYTMRVVYVEQKYWEVYVTFTQDADYEITYSNWTNTYTKVTWSWPATFMWYYYDNFVFLKAIERDKPWYFNELIWPKEFSAIDSPNIYKLQLKIEMGQRARQMQRSKITDIVYIADIVQDDTNQGN